MELDNLKKIKGNKLKRNRVGRGIGSGHGGHTSGKGHKGQKARTGNSIPRGFEGGQVPLFRKFPKIGGFKSKGARKKTSISLFRLNLLEEGTEVTPKSLIKAGLIGPKEKQVKIINTGTLTKKLTLKGFLYTEGVKETILKSGSVIVD